MVAHVWLGNMCVLHEQMGYLLAAPANNNGMVWLLFLGIMSRDLQADSLGTARSLCTHVLPVACSH
jgi:hypothetical protein